MRNHRNFVAVARNYRTGKKRHRGGREPKKIRIERKIEKRELKISHMVIMDNGAEKLEEGGKIVLGERPKCSEKWNIADLIGEEDFQKLLAIKSGINEAKGSGGTPDTIGLSPKKKEKNLEKFCSIMSRWIMRGWFKMRK